ncbi:hypothetical protein VaNZ11_006062 [Volvox africanus]|uniref:CobW/HypB/UreG nucleotide-binding domain-containing protein n=1 Tax=Volvox africanus TaxID=51714 RepID=A0ABQ5S0H3_9CHLO|nr:hypothetical protein VaNZ11_006062 [Volvox africanus]
MKLPIPVNIITGALGVGKTTAVTHLLGHKPSGEKWALLVNEFGALVIDAGLVEAGIGLDNGEEARRDAAGGSRNLSSTPAPGIVVRELAGGCLCCTLSGPLGVAIAQLVRQAKPDRLIIEPSGLGHPAGLLDTLYGEHLRSALDVKAVICLVDVRAAAAAEGELVGPAGDSGGGGEGAPSSSGSSGGGWALGTGLPAAASLETIQDQINVADVVVGHKADLASPQQLDAFGCWAEQLYPPKAQVVLASHGRIDPALLDLPRAPVFRPMFNPQTHRHRRRAAQRAVKAHTPCPPHSEVPPGATAAAAATPAAPASATDEPSAESLASGLATIKLTADPNPDPDLGMPDDLVGTGGQAEALPQLQLKPGQPLRFPSAQPHKSYPQSRLPLPQQGEHRHHHYNHHQQHPDVGSGKVEGVDVAGGEEPQVVSCGWLFSSEEIFDRGRLGAVVSELWRGAARVKGIFRVGKSSYVVPYFRPDGNVELRPVAYRRESRLEVIVLIPASRRDVIPQDMRGASSPLADAEATVAMAGCPALETSSVATEPERGPVRLEAAVAAADWDAVERALLGALQRRC